MVPTVSQLEAEGYTHIRCECRCRHTVDFPFTLVRKQHPQLILSAMTLAELATMMRCTKCGARDFGFRAWRQSDANGFGNRAPGAGDGAAARIDAD